MQSFQICHQFGQKREVFIRIIQILDTVLHIQRLLVTDCSPQESIKGLRCHRLDNEKAAAGSFVKYQRIHKRPQRLILMNCTIHKVINRNLRTNDDRCAAFP